MPTIRRRLLVAVAAGVPAGFVPLGPAGGVLAHAVAGFVIAGLVFALPLLRHLLGHDAPSTRERVAGRDGDAAWYDVVVILVGLASLVAVGILLVATKARGAELLVDGVLGLVAVAVGWVCVHTVYVLRYARLYFEQLGRTGRPPIDFNSDDDPAFSDFAYFSFNLGMAYQVSDTSVRSSVVRRVVLGHTLLAYVYGTTIIASTINLVVGIGGQV